MHLVVTGANGFIGKALTRRLLSASDHFLTLLDLEFTGPENPRVRRLAGSIAEEAIVAQAFAVPVDAVLHLASVPGGIAEQNYELARRVNLDGTTHLLEHARTQSLAAAKPVVFVFASSIAVLGAPLPKLVDDATPLHPKLTYGAQKLIGEVLLEDFHRRGWVRGRALRLPGVVARPPQRSGLMSAFLSDLIRELSAGRPFACPISAESTTWLMSVPCVVANLLHATTMSTEACRDARVWTLPALRMSMAELVDAIAEVHGPAVLSRISYGSNAALEANFGRYPPLRTPGAHAAGFLHDGDLPTLVRRALL